MLLEPLAHRGRGAEIFSSSGGMLSGGGGGGAPSRLSSTHLPRSTGDVRVAYDEMRQDRALRDDAAALVAVELDALELSPSTPLMP